eukprot:CAMPEP_0173434856 /NCGR_PEP_ID=MMETSP1357-20121228/13618_1 /TAXON_ID=77926 /ORGANISM="Hemiselmis rufescens, Strain PCC563" /LENGTH=259 /DNA_ID=CAMNT_0014399769 /DNA_START=147 /DNA_END=924 /DNA_ORIENTATION=+
MRPIGADDNPLARLEGRGPAVRARGAPERVPQVAAAAGRGRGGRRDLAVGVRLELLRQAARAILARLLAPALHARAHLLWLEVLLAQQSVLVHQVVAVVRGDVPHLRGRGGRLLGRLLLLEGDGHGGARVPVWLLRLGLGHHPVPLPLHRVHEAAVHQAVGPRRPRPAGAVPHAQAAALFEHAKELGDDGGVDLGVFIGELEVGPVRRLVLEGEGQGLRYGGVGCEAQPCRVTEDAGEAWVDCGGANRHKKDHAARQNS